MKRSTELSRWQWQCEWQCLNADCVQDFSLETLLRDAHQYKTIDLSSKRLNEIPNEVHTQPSIHPSNVVLSSQSGVSGVHCGTPPAEAR